jgi:hypothetical protein
MRQPAGYFGKKQQISDSSDRDPQRAIPPSIVLLSWPPRNHLVRGRAGPEPATDTLRGGVAATFGYQ